MKCHGCGHEFPNTSTRCPRCHRSTSRRGRTSTDSRLLEFPRRARISPPPEANTKPLPAWRAELNERVRAIRANRVASSPQIESVPEDQVRLQDPDGRVVITRQDEARSYYTRDTNALGVTTHAEAGQPTASATTSVRRPSNIIVEAALIRVKRATENASRAALPKIEPARSIQATVSVPIDRQATARALEPEPEIEPKIDLPPTILPEAISEPVMKSSAVEATELESQVHEAAAQAPSSPAKPLYIDDSVELSTLPVIDDLEPLDYLEAEVRKVDKALGAEFQKNESPSLFTHAVIGFVDLLALAISCSPFLAFIRIADGSFLIGQTKLASIAIVGLIAFFYFALTQCLCGKTFGMMLTNTRIVNALNFEPLSASQALVRTAGYFIAAAPALTGLLWAVIDRRHRGLHDFISGTMVVRDF